MSELATRITNLYLYGQTTTPENLANANLIRPADVTTPTTQDVVTFMTTGAGRFATGFQFDLVKWFLDPAPFGYRSPSISVGEYSAAELAQLLGLQNSPLIIRQRSFDDGAGDYAERTYVWNTGSFIIGDDARFVVEADGSRYIRNFSVVPNGRENFDFECNDSIAAAIGNSVLQRDLDPSNIGRRVIVDFTGTVEPTARYTIENYLAERDRYISWSVMPELGRSMR